MANDLIAYAQVLWEDPSNIQVCWETPKSFDGALDPALHSYAEEKEWVRHAVRNSWSAANPRIQFTGWGDCHEGSRGVRIRVLSDEDGPRVVKAGRLVDGFEGGLVLAFDLQAQYEMRNGSRFFAPCLLSEENRKTCIEGIAVHEFGHVLGLRHEQDRSDVAPECADQSYWGEGGVVVGEYDPLSIMNYCRENRLINWALSYMDHKGILALYPPSEADPSLLEKIWDWGRPAVRIYWDDANGPEAEKGLMLELRFAGVDESLLSELRGLSTHVELVYTKDGSRAQLQIGRGGWSVEDDGSGKYTVYGNVSFEPAVDGRVHVYWNGKHLKSYQFEASSQ